jgi:hypothetical protein
MKRTGAKPRSRAGARLYVLEGPDGVGKTTLAQGLAGKLCAVGVNADYLAFPGGERGTVGELVYRIHHSRVELGLEAVTPTALQILHVAAHADAIEQSIVPRLELGHTVILDRYWWSVWVYGLATGVSQRVLRGLVALESLCWGSLRPAAIILVDRTRPWEPGHGIREWRSLRAEYRRLARREATNGRVITFINDVPTDEAVNALASAVISPTTPGRSAKRRPRTPLRVRQRGRT